MPRRRAGEPSRGRAGDPEHAAGERLARYGAKRDFARTPEPGPTPGAQGGRRFVIHEHSARRLHWDLRLERDGALASWAIPKGMPEAPGENRLAVWTEDHPLQYADFEGEIPAGEYGAGTMSIWDRGSYEELKWEPRKIEVALHGERLEGRYALFPISREDEPREWMIHRMDPPADPTGEPLPELLAPMLARTGELPANEREWAFEVKWDGVRAIVRSAPGELALQGRNLNDITARYPELGRLNRALSSHRAMLDGEIVALDEHGRPSFEALQRRMHLTAEAQVRRLAAQAPVTYMIFDLLWLDGHSLLEAPYRRRRELLEGLALEGERWRTPAALAGRGAQVLAATAEQGLEGIVAKRLDSTYRPGQRSGAWLKIKNSNRQELVIGGWLPGKGRRGDRVGALLVGYFQAPGRLRYAGRVGSGFSEADLDMLTAALLKLRVPTAPFVPGGPRLPREARFCEPRLVAEVRFSEWTRTGSLRHPVYVGLREDKRAEEVVREQTVSDAATEQRPRALELSASATAARVSVGGRELALSNLTKVLYPASGLAKREVIAYYAAVAGVLLPHLRGRALTVTRWPDGVEGKSFFQKQAPAHRPEWVATAAVESSRKRIDYVLADDEQTLVWLANLAAIELHVPLHRAAEPDRPGAVVFDLDPGPPASVLECCQVAIALRGMLEQLGLECVVKTSGSKGLQVYVPLVGGDADYAQTKTFARAVAETFERAQPELVVAQMTRRLRTGKVLIDWSQNDRNKTTVCAYSLRAMERPTVSTPLDWEEVRSALAAGEEQRLRFEYEEVLARVADRGDLFAAMLSLAQRLPPL